MTHLYTIHGVKPSKVERIVREMQTLGAPSIRVVDCGDHYRALEGTHRLAAAEQLRIAPQLVILAPDDLVRADSLDWPDLQEDQTYTAGELAAEIASSGNGCYSIEYDGTLRLVVKARPLQDNGDGE